MKRILFPVFISLVGLLAKYTVASNAEEKKAFVGSTVELPCHIDTKVCGNLHSVKFYRETSRIYVYSQVGGVERAEGDSIQRMRVNYTQDKMQALLIIDPVEIEDEATYKCEITYLEVLENCDVVQLIKLKTLVRPTAVKMLHQDGKEFKGPVLGPYNEGTKVEVTCEAIAGRPIPDVKWYNGSREIKSTYDKIEFANGTGTGIAKLKLILSRGDLQGNFECRVESAALEQPITTTFTADVNVRPTDIRLYGITNSVVQGTNVKLRCDVYGAKPSAEVKWLNGTTDITNMMEVTIVGQRDGTFTTKSVLPFIATRWENEKTFHCQADNEVMRDNGESYLERLLIAGVEYPPVVYVSNTNITVNESGKTILHCNYTSNPMALLGIVWKKDGQNLTLRSDDNEDLKYELQQKYEGGEVDDLALVIKNVSRKDMGTYTCVCRNTIGTRESENGVFLNVQYTPSVEVKMDPATPVRSEDKGNVTLFCEVNSGNPNALSKVKWFLNGELILELPECNYTTYDDDGNGEGYGGPYCGIDSSVLVLLNVSETFAGNYSCQGKNVVGWGPKSDDQELIVYYPPKGTKLQATPTKVVKKASVTLMCSVEKPGIPEDVTFEWYRGSHLVPDVSTANWTTNPVTLETKSNFTCVAKNAGGSSAPASLWLDVLAPPAFIQNLPPYQGILMSSENISLTCRVECFPLCKIFWLKDNERITNDNNKYRINEIFLPSDTNKNDFESVESTLIWQLQNWPGRQLDKSAPNSYYSCVSTSNEVGAGVNSTTEIAVDYPPDNLTANPRVVKVKEHERPKDIVCSGKGHPQLSYIWRKDDDMDRNLSSTNILSLKAVTRADSGKYICQAFNKHGISNTSSFIKVEYIPECTLEIIDQDGHSTLLCTADAEPTTVGFTFKIKGDNDTIDTDDVKTSGLRGYLPLDSGIDTFRTYQCYVTNSVGVSAPCECDVAGTASWWKRFANENLIILIAVLVGIIICVIIIIIIIILVCRRKHAGNKLPNQSTMGDKGGLGGVPPGGGTGNPLNDPDKLFYENLPFHGMQNPPNKPYRPEFSDLDYADVDYRSYGPINYKAASIYAAMKRKQNANKLQEQEYDDLL